MRKDTPLKMASEENVIRMKQLQTGSEPHPPHNSHLLGPRDEEVDDVFLPFFLAGVGPVFGIVVVDFFWGHDALALLVCRV